jgi:hypothetical protein
MRSTFRARGGVFAVMDAYYELRSTVLIVVGHGLLAEEQDRPVAYELKREVTQRAGGSGGRVVVVTDLWLMGQELGEFFPAIALGGPAANLFTQELHEDLPVAWERAEQAFIQVADDGKRAALWGADEAGTREAVARFVADGLLERFLALVWGT